MSLEAADAHAPDTDLGRVVAKVVALVTVVTAEARRENLGGREDHTTRRPARITTSRRQGQDATCQRCGCTPATSWRGVPNAHIALVTDAVQSIFACTDPVRVEHRGDEVTGLFPASSRNGRVDAHGAGDVLAIRTCSPPDGRTTWPSNRLVRVDEETELAPTTW